MSVNKFKFSLVGISLLLLAVAISVVFLFVVIGRTNEATQETEPVVEGAEARQNQDGVSADTPPQQPTPIDEQQAKTSSTADEVDQSQGADRPTLEHSDSPGQNAVANQQTETAPPAGEEVNRSRGEGGQTGDCDCGQVNQATRSDEGVRVWRGPSTYSIQMHADDLVAELEWLEKNLGRFLEESAITEISGDLTRVREKAQRLDEEISNTNAALYRQDYEANAEAWEASEMALYQVLNTLDLVDTLRLGLGVESYEDQNWRHRLGVMDNQIAAAIRDVRKVRTIVD